MAVEECSLYAFTANGVTRKTTPKDVKARTDIEALTKRIEALEKRVSALEAKIGGN